MWSEILDSLFFFYQFLKELIQYYYYWILFSFDFNVSFITNTSLYITGLTFDLSALSLSMYSCISPQGFDICIIIMYLIDIHSQNSTLWKKNNGFILFAILDIENFSRWQCRLWGVCGSNDIKKREEEGVFWEKKCLVEIWCTDVETTTTTKKNKKIMGTYSERPFNVKVEILLLLLSS